MRMLSATRLIVAGLCAIAAVAVHAQPAFRGWLGLYKPEQIAWLENENRINSLCQNRDNIDTCHTEKLAPRVSVYPLHSAPAVASPRIGELIVVAVPGKGLSAHFRATDSSDAMRFQPDLFLQDWGYGPYFHQTVTRQQGEWFQLPPDPWKGPVWLRHSGETLLYLQAGDIIELHGAGMVVVDTSAEVLWLRPEQAADQWCREGEPPPLQPAETIRYRRAELSDNHGHLIIRLKYLKGC